MDLTVNEKLQNFIYDIEPDFKKVQVNNDISFAQQAMFALLLLEKNSYTLKIARGSPNSLRNAVINVATIGLSLEPTAGLAYLIPRKNEICLDISYLGLIKLAQDAGSIIDVKADVIREEDTFLITGAFTAPTHTYQPLKPRGKIIGAYVVVSTPHGSFLTTVMPIDEIFEIRNASESYKNEKTRNYSPWVRFEGEMIKKTVIRRAYKMWPKTKHTSVLEKAIAVSDNAQAIEFKTEYQIEKEAIDEDFPIPPEEKEIGSPEYRIQNAKLRGKQLKDVDPDELFNYSELIAKRHEKHDPKQWELDVKYSIDEYLKSIEQEEKIYI